MKNITRFCSLVFCILFSACAEDDPIFTADKYACNPGIVNTHPDDNKFQNYIDEKTKNGVPGMAMLVETPEGSWQGASGLADIPSNIPMRACNIMRVGSITKTFTAMLILLLHEEELLDINDNISLYLDDHIAQKIKNAENATIKNLLSHTSGIADYSDQIDFTLAQLDDPTRQWTMMEELAYIYGEGPQFEVGTKWNYCNTNFLLLGLIAEKAGGKKMEKLYEEKIFSPLNMHATSFNNIGTNPTNIARGYWDADGELTIRDATDISFAHHSTAGGICSNIEDLHVFIKAINTPGILLSQSSAELMQSPNTVPRLKPSTNNDKAKLTNLGLGLFILETDYGTAIGHGGRIRGYSSFMLYFPDTETYFIYMMNGSNGGIKDIEQQIYKNEMVELLFE